MTTLHEVEKPYMKQEIPKDFRIGDSVEVGLRIREGDKERIQTFAGTVIASRGSGIQASVTVRRIVAGEGVELSLPLHSPKVMDIKVVRRGRVRRAKLYYLRGRVGKATRIKEDLRAGALDRKKSSLKKKKKKKHSAAAEATDTPAEDGTGVPEEPAKT